MSSFISWIDEELNIRGWSQNELARRMGFTSASVSRTMTQQNNITYEFCVGIAKAFVMDKEDVLVRAGLLNPRTRTIEGDEIQRIYNELPPEERKGILDFAKWKLQQIRREKSAH